MIQNTLDFTDEEKERAASHTDRILRMLQRSQVVSTDLMNVTHRFSACIRNLRVRGYIIEVEKLSDGTSLHTLRGYTPLVEVTDEMKMAYSRTGHWATKRKERMEFDDFRCCHCRSVAELQVHHWVYELFNESLEDLVTLCDSCHERIHKYDCVKLHFPEYVTAFVAKCLQEATP